VNVLAACRSKLSNGPQSEVFGNATWAGSWQTLEIKNKDIMKIKVESAHEYLCAIEFQDRDGVTI
jgi:hypothetical protein